jgi:serine phosphatase RsbU (regulator of sigma subunit)
VADKGIGAALFMTSTRTLLRAYAEEYPDKPNQALEASNRRITHDTHGGLFVTLFYGVLDPAQGKLLYCNAGHNPPILLHADGRYQELKGTGFPVAVFEQATWTTEWVLMEPGSRLVLYTDGVTEAENPQGEMFGLERVAHAARSITGEKDRAQQVQDAILEALHTFCAGAPQGDDITLVVIVREQNNY